MIGYYFKRKVDTELNTVYCPVELGGRYLYVVKGDWDTPEQIAILRREFTVFVPWNNMSFVNNAVFTRNTDLMVSIRMLESSDVNMFNVYIPDLPKQYPISDDTLTSYDFTFMVGRDTFQTLGSHNDY